MLVARCWLGMVDRLVVMVERPQRSEEERVDAGEGFRRMGNEMQLVHAMGITVLTGCWVASQRAGVQPYRGARTRVRRHDG